MFSLHGRARRHIACRSQARICGICNFVPTQSARYTGCTRLKSNSLRSLRAVPSEHAYLTLRYQQYTRKVHRSCPLQTQKNSGQLPSTPKNFDDNTANGKDKGDVGEYRVGIHGYTGIIQSGVGDHLTSPTLYQKWDGSQKHFVDPVGYTNTDNFSNRTPLKVVRTCDEAPKAPTHSNIFRASFFSPSIEHDVSSSAILSQTQVESFPFRPKVDLSYHNLRERETSTSGKYRVASPYQKPTSFRGNSGMRSVVHQYLRHIEPLLCQSSLSEEQMCELDYWLTFIFSNSTVRAIQNLGYQVEDVASWSWILRAETPELRVRRYVYLAQRNRSAQRSTTPLFIPLQLLRSKHLGSGSLNLIIAEIKTSLDHGNQWGKESGSILLIRLLRHARMVDVSCYEGIAELAARILQLKADGHVHDNVQRLTHFYNRFLSLIALPVARHPFLSINVQQRAQLRIARHMAKSELHIPINREGYRALARVQLMHQKTVEEYRWSAVKAPSWPPWRRDELGIDATIEYGGQQSRVSKVIKRLLEAGYGPESMEHEAQILAGWDTDKSPTIQVRRVPHRRPLSWIRGIFGDKLSEQPEVDHNVWAARVAATRSVREAWVCFYSYMQVTMDRPRQLRAYHEMFHKLFARTQDSDQRTVPSPGDGKEVFPDPISPRDVVYVPKEPPSVEELYAQMLQDGIKPAGRLLSSLIDNANTLKQGLDYIDSSSLGDVKKDVLLHPENYPTYFIRNIFATVPEYLLASYLGLLTKRFWSDDVELYWPGSRSIEERGSLPLTRSKPLHYGMTLLQIWNPTYMPAYHAVLEGIYTQFSPRNVKKDRPPTRKHSYLELWKIAKHLIELLEQQGLRVDLTCFRKIVLLVRNSMIRAPEQYVSIGDCFVDTVPFVKSIFVKALGGHIKQGRLVLPSSTLAIGQQPYWKDIESLIILLGYGRDFISVVDLLQWLREGEEYLECMDGNGYKKQRLTCAVRVAMELSWTKGKSRGANSELVQQARNYIRDWGWAEDVDVLEFMEHHRAWFAGMQAAAKQPIE